MTVLTNNDLPDAPNCVVYKDSYGNPFVLYLTQHYHRVYALDFRQYDSMGMRSFIQAYHINDVIWLRACPRPWATAPMSSSTCAWATDQRKEKSIWQKRRTPA